MSFFNRTNKKLNHHYGQLSGAFEEGEPSIIRIDLLIKGFVDDVKKRIKVVGHEKAIIIKQKNDLESLRNTLHRGCWANLEFVRRNLTSMQDMKNMPQKRQYLETLEKEMDKICQAMDEAHSTFKRVRNDHKLLSDDEHDLEK